MRTEDLQIGDYIQNPLGLIGRVQSIKYMRKIAKICKVDRNTLGRYIHSFLKE